MNTFVTLLFLVVLTKIEVGFIGWALFGVVALLHLIADIAAIIKTHSN